MSKCPACGYEENEDSSICLQCGSPLDASANVEDTPPAAAPDSQQGQGKSKGGFFRANVPLDKTETGQSSSQQSSSQQQSTGQGQGKSQPYSSTPHTEDYQDDFDNAIDVTALEATSPGPVVLSVNPVEEVPYQFPMGGEPSPVNVTKKKNGILIGVLIGIVILILGSGTAFGYIYYQDRQERAEIEAQDKDAAQVVSDEIDAIGAVSLSKEEVINNARTSYNDLTKDQKSYVENEDVLIAAETKLTELQRIDAEQKAAEEQAKAEAEAKAAAEREAQKSTLVRAQNQYYVYCYVDANGGLNLRYGPGTNYNIILNIPNGSDVIAYAEQGSWCFVEYKGRQGWVAMDYLYAY